MELDNPAVLFSGILIGAAGMGFFISGKRNASPRAQLAGVALSIIPFVGHSLQALRGATGLCASVLYVSGRRG
ncbi:MAG: hypothetical protein ACF8MF_08140 [Phycisphaerales bacterium JB052]